MHREDAYGEIVPHQPADPLTEQLAGRILPMPRRGHPPDEHMYRITTCQDGFHAKGRGGRG